MIETEDQNLVKYFIWIKNKIWDIYRHKKYTPFIPNYKSFWEEKKIPNYKFVLHY
jgi:hypothetical protein